MATIHGRVIAKDTGLPLRRCTVMLRSSYGNDTRRAVHGPVRWTDPEPIVTGEGGRFSLEAPALPQLQHSISLRCAGYLHVHKSWAVLREGSDHDLGDVALLPGFVVRGKVIDQNGARVPRLRVTLNGMPSPFREDNDASIAATSDPQGEFVFESAVPPGRWPVGIYGRGASLTKAMELQVSDPGEGDDTNYLVVRVTRPPSISGHVFDDQRRPMRFVEIGAIAPQGFYRRSAQTRADGSFEIFADDDAPGELRLAVLDPGLGQPVPLPDLVGWGTAGIVIELPRAHAFELEVTERGSGKPIEEYAVRCHALVDEIPSKLTEPRLAQPHPGGKVTVDRVWNGPNRFMVVPRDPSLDLSGWIEIEGKPEMEPQRVALPRLEPVQLRIVDAQGTSVANTHVWLVDHPGGKGFPPEFGLFSDPRGSRIANTSRHTPLPLAQSHGQTDAEGNVRLWHGTPAGELVLAADSGDGTMRIHRGLVLQGEREGVDAEGNVVVR